MAQAGVSGERTRAACQGVSKRTQHVKDGNVMLHEGHVHIPCLTRLNRFAVPRVDGRRSDSAFNPPIAARWFSTFTLRALGSQPLERRSFDFLPTLPDPIFVQSGADTHICTRWLKIFCS